MTTRALPSDPMTVSADEFGVLRVFATGRDDIITHNGVGAMIGAELDAEKVEVIDTNDIAALGLATYLAEGYGISDDDLEDAAEALNAIDGRVALIPTSAFMGAAVALSPSPPLRFVGIYIEAEGARPRAMTESASSRMLPELEPAPEQNSNSTKSHLAIAMIASLAIGALVLWLFL